MVVPQMCGLKAAQLSCAAPKRERNCRFAGKGTYHLISAYKPRSFLKSWGRPAGGGLSAAHKRTKLEFCRGEVLSAHFCLKPYPPVADLNSTLSAQRNTGSASNKNTVARKKLLAQRRRREGVYYPKGHRQPSSRSKRDFSRRSRHKGAGG